MNETSKGRRLSGKLAILAATAIALPLTATVVPVFAQAEPAAEAPAEKKVELRKHKVIVVKSTDGKDVTVDVSGDAETPFVKKIEKDGKTIILRSNKELSEADVEKMVAEAEASRAKAEWSVAEGERNKMVKRVIVHSSADGAQAHAIRMMGDTEKMVDGMKIAALIPEIDIAEFKGKCEDGQPVTTNVEGSDGKKQSRVRIVLCGKGQANMARKHAIQGLKEARDEIKSDGEMPASVRDDVLKSLDQKIEKLEKQLKDDGAASGDA